MKKFFMVATHKQVIKNKKLGGKVSIATNPDAFKYDEEFRCTKNLKRRDNTEAGIILDVANQKVVKNRYGNQNFEELFKYFTDNYADYINTWLQKQIQE